ncbi:MAG: membrane protein insertase YidC [Bacilli bacterium]
MNRKLKTALIFGGLLVGAGVLSSCTASFCSNEDTSRILYVLDKGVTRYYSGAEVAEKKLKDTVKLEGYDDVYTLRSFENSPKIKAVIKTASSQQTNYFIPSLDYFSAFDDVVLEYAIKNSGKTTTKDTTAADIKGILKENGYVKFLGKNEKSEDTLFVNYAKINKVLEERIAGETKPPFNVPGIDFINLYKNTMNQAVAAYRSCVTTVDGEYGNYGEDGEQIFIGAKSWGYAWSKGFLEGLLVYPIAYMTDFFAMSFAGGTTAGLAAGWPQLLAIVLTTFIVKVIIMLCTLKSTLGQGKMQAVQPQIAKLQQKYPNANTNQYEKNRLSQETMALYKKNHISPWGQMIVMVIQFPVFICVWGALSGSAALSTGSFLDLNLSSTVLTALQQTQSLPGNGMGWWTALGLFIVMSVAQFLATKIPTWLSARKMKNVTKLNSSATASSSASMMKYMPYIMLVVIIVMGLTLPSAMGVYWLVSAFLAILQSVAVYFINNRKKKGSK